MERDTQHPCSELRSCHDVLQRTSAAQPRSRVTASRTQQLCAPLDGRRSTGNLQRRFAQHSSQSQHGNNLSRTRSPYVGKSKTTFENQCMFYYVAEVSRNIVNFGHIQQKLVKARDPQIWIVSIPTTQPAVIPADPSMSARPPTPIGTACITSPP